MIWRKFPTVLDETDTEPCIINLLEIATVETAGENYCKIHLMSGHEVQVAEPVNVIWDLLVAICPS